MVTTVDDSCKALDTHLLEKYPEVHAVGAETLTSGT